MFDTALFRWCFKSFFIGFALGFAMKFFKTRSQKRRTAYDDTYYWNHHAEILKKRHERYKETGK